MPFDPLWINASGGVPAYTANELRTAMALAMMYGGRAVGARQGVRPGGTGYQVSVDGSLNITVKAGCALVDPALSTPQGPYWVALTADDSTTLDVTAHDPTNPRIDIVYVRVRDHDEDASGLREAQLGYTAGTPAPSPAQPATPASALLLASLAVPATSGAVAVTDRRVWTVATGGILPVAAAADIAAGTAGRYRHRLDTKALEVDNGSAWVSVGASPRMGCTLSRVATQTLPDAALTSVSWDTEAVDTDSLWTSGTNIVIPANGAGLWSIFANVFIAAALTGIGQTRINVGGNEQIRASFADLGSSVGIVLPLAASDVVTVQAYADTSAGTTMTANVVCYRVGP